jgi:hypothetical protein
MESKRANDPSPYSLAPKTPFIEMHMSGISYPSNSEFGVQVALIIIVNLVGVKTETRGRSGASGPCYNCRRINDLGNQAAGAKIGQFLHRHILGDNVKLIVPQSHKSLAGTRKHKRFAGNGI